MWMAYSQAGYPAAVDLPTSVKRLKCLLLDLEFEAEHSINYDFRSDEQIEQLKKDAENYFNGSEVCQTFLDGTINIETACQKFIALGLKNKLYYVLKFLPIHIVLRYNLVDDSEDDEI